MDCFSRFAKALDSLQGVRPEMSAAAGGGAAAEETRREESAKAAEKVLREEEMESSPCCCWGTEEEHEMEKRGLKVTALGFWERGLERAEMEDREAIVVYTSPTSLPLLDH
ncbi:hypothetical protein C4D60_Mb06t32280 [Musa balbisiana]|uniref:Uncharacterized protein n=1 Tax=Musa balbisiana TaxID=52838 RepID=A0A4S8IS78_MUSBA|nr:hypothetical protein C4D60_Mb06t32280 [Musa balbisiana]